MTVISIWHSVRPFRVVRKFQLKKLRIGGSPFSHSSPTHQEHLRELGGEFGLIFQNDFEFPLFAWFLFFLFSLVARVLNNFTDSGHVNPYPEYKRDGNLNFGWFD